MYISSRYPLCINNKNNNCSLPNKKRKAKLIMNSNIYLEQESPNRQSKIGNDRLSKIGNDQQRESEVIIF